MAGGRLNSDLACLPRQLLEDAVDRFEQAWQAGTRPTIADYCPPGSADREALILELALIDIEYRLKAGNTSVFAEYLERFPELKQNNDAVLALFAAERRWLPEEQLSPAILQLRSSI